MNIPDSVTDIGNYAFYNCKSLKSVTVPDSVTWIGTEVFCCCESLMTIRFTGTKAAWQAIAKREDWNSKVPAPTVICANGEVKL